MAQNNGASEAKPVDFKDRPVELIGGPDLPVIYANNATLRTSQFDMRIDLGLIEEASEERLVVRQQVRVMMSIPHAKLFSDILADHIASYEKKFGKVTIVKRSSPTASKPPDGQSPAADQN